jgi:dolichol-phosphate mannosyltransferase
MGDPTRRQLVSLVVPCYNESEVFPHLERELVALADRLNSEFDVEIVLVDDGSKDDTWTQIQSFGERDKRVKGIGLSRNFGHQAALTCGYDLSQGAAVVCMDADLQDPPEAVEEMVGKWKEGYDLVQAVRMHREGETRFKLLTATAFYRLIRALGASHVTADTGDFRLMSRRALDALSQMREHHRFIRGMVGLVGFRTTQIYYTRRVRKAGATKYPFRKMLAFACDAIVSFSTVPLRLSFIAAAFISLITVSYLGIAAIRHIVWGAELVPGWSSLILSIVVLGASNLISIGILGEYVGRTYEQVKQRPLYYIQESTTSANASLADANPAQSA